MEGAIRVLIVDDIVETRENLRKLMQFESDIKVVGAARTGGEAIQLSRDTKPDVVLMDINMPDMDGITATKAVLEDVPFAQIIILSVQSDADYMRRAMQAGARDFITKPPSGDDLIATIRMVAERAREQREKMATPVIQVVGPGEGARPGGPGRQEGKLLTIYSAKGGVGCTTLATNLAIALHTVETPTVLVDMNLQYGDVAVFLYLQVKNTVVDLAARSTELDPMVVEDVLMRHESGVSVLAGSPRPELADEVGPDQARQVLRFLKRMFSYVIVDTSSSMDDITLAVLDSTDLLITIATPDIPAIKDARLVLDLLNVLEFPKERVMLVLNKLDRRTGITPQAVSENLKFPVDGMIPTDERTVAASINRGVPLMMGDKGRVPTKNILDLLGIIKERLVAEAVAESAVGESD